MRRPVKPFVTEYKGPSRRPPQQAAASLRRTYEDHAAAPSVNESFSRGGPDHAHSIDDSYEAAMRAADALFAPNGHKPPSDAAFSDNASTFDDAPQDGASGISPRGGRILRVLDEPPVPALAELEEERAPKRRGRKPGSKNKPKAGIVAPSAAEHAGTAEPFDWSTSFPAAPTPKVAPLSPAYHASAARGRAATPAVETPDAPQRAVRRVQAVSSDYAARNETRFAWVRTKLAPGEQWKRRLPKVCW
ncbi:MAG: hypothetical protein P4L76_02305 [Beijerinckiaceae bacterium]|nr:hypothetical protein [Beijerinckiaceae bacterium]